MGSWLGRVAARYRLSVAQLVEDYHLQIPLETSRAGWLLLPLLQSDVLQRLADLARMKIGLLRDIQTPLQLDVRMPELPVLHKVPVCES